MRPMVVSRLQDGELTGGLVAAANFRMDLPAAKQLVHGFGNVAVHGQGLPIQNLHADLEGRFEAARSSTVLLSAAPARFVVAQGHV